MPTAPDSSTTPRNPDIIGAPLDRTDGRLKVTGGVRYSAEVSMPGLVYGALITSTISDGTVASMDTAAAERAPGVLAVFTPFNMPKLPKATSRWASGQVLPRATSRSYRTTRSTTSSNPSE